jgi:hypothetical protein
MHNMFHKLGVGSRVELARVIEQADRAKQARPKRLERFKGPWPMWAL